VAIVSLVYYVTPLRLSLLQELFTRFFYVPIILGGLWFGLWGGVRVSLLITFICIPHAFLAFRHDPALFYDEVLELLLFNLLGLAVGAFQGQRPAATSIEPRASDSCQPWRDRIFCGS